MKIPAIEELRINIQDPRSREAVDEVLSCFYSQNLRSAIVMLYATVVSDVYYKCNDLWDTYKDAGAKQIVDDIQQEWRDHPTSSDWEKTIVEKCHAMNKIIDGEDLIHFQSLQRERNLCAHPIIDGSNTLYQPNAATVQGMMIDMMRGILCKPSFMSKHLLGSFLDDIEKVKDVIKKRGEMEDYIRAKYLDKINNEKGEYDLFKKLWRFVFQKTDNKSHDNRKENLWALCLIYERNEGYIKTQINREQDYYGANINIDDVSCIRAFIMFVNVNQEVYDKLPDDFRIKIVPKVQADTELKACAFFLSPNLKQHADSLTSDISSSAALYISRHLRNNYNNGEALDFLIRIYSGANYYDDADDYYDNLIAPCLGFFTEQQLVRILEVSNDNSQIYGRRRAAMSIRAIKNQIRKIKPDFDFSQYRNI